MTSNGQPDPLDGVFPSDQEAETLIQEEARKPGFTSEPEDEDPFAGLENTVPLPNQRLKRMSEFAGRFKAWQPAREVLVKVRSVPTIFAQYDRATRVGGHPLERFVTIHGVSGHGKTTFCHGLGMSFLAKGHFYLFVDAEMTTPITWLSNLMVGYQNHPGFLASRPQSYEETVEAVRDFTFSLNEAREKGEIDKDTTALIVVDSIRKLVPKDLLKRVQSGKEGVDGMKGRAAQIKAAMNAAWLDELVPLLYHTSTSMAVIARETEGDGDYDAPKVGGGNALIYDSSLVIRVSRAEWIKESAADNARILGEKHRIQIRKTKVAGKEGKVVNAFFHTSNGAVTPEGFDRPRDLIELAEKYSIIERSGSWYSWPKCRKRWQGVNAVVKSLHADRALCERLEQEIRSRFRHDEDLSADEEEEK